MNLEEIINIAARDLPDNHQIHIIVENGAGYIEAYDVET